MSFFQFITKGTRQNIGTTGCWGENDFLTILPEISVYGSGRLASRLCKQFVHLQQVPVNPLIIGAVSFGVTGFIPEFPRHNATPGTLLFAVGRCLVRVKATGDNQVLCCIEFYSPFPPVYGCSIRNYCYT